MRRQAVQSRPGEPKERHWGIPSYLPLIELQRGPETPLQRTVGELGVDVGKLGVDSPSRSANMVEPAPQEEKPTVTVKTWG